MGDSPTITPVSLIIGFRCEVNKLHQMIIAPLDSVSIHFATVIRE